jgi:TRAP-type C4-dicarboxylate transport system substrate-binding protein
MFNLTLAHQVMAVNQAALDQLPADVRTIFLAKAKEWVPRYRSEIIKADIDARKVLIEKGMTLRDATPDEEKKLRAVTQPIADEWAAKTGDVGTQMLKAAIQACS